jgi:hypothetical protein
MTSIVLKIVRRLPPITVVAAIVLTGALSGIAPAGPAYTVNVVVNPTVSLASPFSVVMSGVAANSSVLVLYVNTTHKCKRRGAAEAQVPTDQRTFITRVVGAYAETAPEVAQTLGVHYVCAYLRQVEPPPAIFRARASASYQVTSAAG